MVDACPVSARGGARTVACMVPGHVGSAVPAIEPGRRSGVAVEVAASPGGAAGRSAVELVGGRGGRRSGLAELDRLGHDPDGLALIGVAGRGGHLVAMGREARLLDRQGHVVDLVVAGLVTLRIRAVVRG